MTKSAASRSGCGEKARTYDAVAPLLRACALAPPDGRALLEGATGIAGNILIAADLRKM